jgi:hypothetical protein
MSTDLGSLEGAFVDQCGARSVLGGMGDVEQLDLLRGPDDKLPPDAFRRLRVEQRGRGRPAGARNKRSADLGRLICEKHGDPQQYLASVYSTPLDQLVEMMLIAEGVPEREDRLMALCDSVETMVKAAHEEKWSEAKLKMLGSMLNAVERAAGSMKSKPGEIALKALGHQITAAKEVSPYVHSKKPVEVSVTNKLDGVIFMPAPQGSAADPIDAVMRRTVEAINSGAIDPARVVDMRFDAVAGEFVGGEADGDGAE